MCNHEVWVEDGFVHLANDDDSYYEQIFKTPNELHDFMEHLIRAGIDAWGIESIFSIAFPIAEPTENI
jgi:hypothetical protein